MTTWFHVPHEDEGVRLYFEADAEGWATRHVAIRIADEAPVTAASLTEVLALRDSGDLAAMRRYEARYGVLAEAPLDGWREQPGAVEIPAVEFETLWSTARLVLARM